MNSVRYFENLTFLQKALSAIKSWSSVLRVSLGFRWYNNKCLSKSLKISKQFLQKWSISRYG